MRISGFHVDGFGALADFRIDDLSPGLVILDGPNEAGKSTMLDFLTAMLFGFPSPARQPALSLPCPRRPSRRSARARRERRCGRLGREALANRALCLSTPRCSPSGAPMAHRRPKRSCKALGGADETLFRAVFAVDLTDLGNAEAMTRATK